jgi:hypothetical protein
MENLKAGRVVTFYTGWRNRPVRVRWRTYIVHGDGGAALYVRHRTEGWQLWAYNVTCQFNTLEENNK